jgi:uncharacterized protein (TIGR02453 family)
VRPRPRDTLPRVRFEGFGEYAIDFFDGLTEDNSKPFWDDHRHTYDSDVRAPMVALMAELEREFGEFGVVKVFRPYRDVRFSNNKTPYKTHCGAVIEEGRGAGAFYVEVGTEGLRVGGGCFHLEAGQLARYRTAVDTEVHGHALDKIVAKLRRAGWEIKGDRMKTRPRGVAEDHPRLELLRHRSIYAMRGWPPDDTLHERGCFDRVVTAWRALKPINEWARDHVGPADLK